MTDPAWYLVHTKPARETTAAEHLERQGFAAFLPRIRRQIRHAGRWRERVEAMFPRYLFVRLDTDVDNWAPINATIGVSRLVRFGNRPSVVPAGLIEDLRARADGENIVAIESAGEFQPGRRVRVVDGPFAGLEGIVQAKSARDRVDLLLAIVGQGATTRLSTHHLVPC
ncbi:transcriptional activator RfaH [Halofilum ochraceum]|uniref:transcriptional activator RfaH n=1 Tax=Halofilum ochraceum TaxID=1611323 RepID=UPI0008342F66|nr:transcriptional activator RfaH [Halofilum ochraceum]